MCCNHENYDIDEESDDESNGESDDESDEDRFAEVKKEEWLWKTLFASLSKTTSDFFFVHDYSAENDILFSQKSNT